MELTTTARRRKAVFFREFDQDISLESKNRGTILLESRYKSNTNNACLRAMAAAGRTGRFLVTQTPCCSVQKRCWFYVVVLCSLRVSVCLCCVYVVCV